MLGKLYYLLRHMSARDYLPPVPRHLRSDFGYDDVSADDALMMLATKAADPTRARRLLHQSGLTAAEYVRLNRRDKPRPHMRRRFMNWLRHLEGSTAGERVVSSYLRRERERTHFRNGQLEQKYDGLSGGAGHGGGY
jgi:hypothetical protein